MLFGIVIRAIVAGTLGMLASLALGAEPAFAGLGYVAGGLCGTVIFAGLAACPPFPDNP